MNIKDEPNPKIAKFISLAGICSRREAERKIENGTVTVNGTLVLEPKIRVNPTRDIVKINGKAVTPHLKPKIWAFYKPRGLVTTHSDEKGRGTIFDFLKTKKGLPVHIISVGRLDMDSEGLLLITNNGGIAHKLERSNLNRVYKVRGYGDITQRKLDSLKKGITIKGTIYKPLEARIVTNTNQNIWLEIKLQEGKNREIRKILEHFGIKVNRLIRLSYGNFDLGSLKIGEVRELNIKKCGLLRDT